MDANSTRERVKALVGPRLAVWGRCVLGGRGLPRWGNLRRVEPFSHAFGFDRGTPVDRYYLDHFLDRNRAAITGSVLEIQASGYTNRFGHQVREAHTIDVDPRFAATYTCDLAAADMIPDDRYDCFLLPNTLQHIGNLEPALRTALRVVKPGGTILASAAGLLPLVTDTGDYWRLTAEGWRRVLAAQWPGCEAAVEAHGNCLVAIAAMHGLALEELTERELDVHDSRYPVLITMRCQKPARGY